MESPLKLGKLDPFEEAPGPTQTQANIIPGEQRSSLPAHRPPPPSLSLYNALAPLVHTLTCLGASDHLTTTRPTGNIMVCFDVKRKLWTLASVLALLKTQLDFSHGRLG